MKRTSLGMERNDDTSSERPNTSINDEKLWKFTEIVPNNRSIIVRVVSEEKEILYRSC